MKYFIYILFLLIPIKGYALDERKTTDELLHILDTVLDNSHSYVSEKEKRIEQTKNMFASAKTDAERFLVNKMLYDEYYVYNVDSALDYAEQNIIISRKHRDVSQTEEWKLKKIFLLTATGLLKEADEELKEIQKDSLTEENVPLYYEQLIYLYSHLGQYLGNQKYEFGYHSSEVQLAKEVCERIHESDDFYYYRFLSVIYAHAPASHEKEVFKEKLAQKIRASKLCNREDAILAYSLAIINKNEGNEELYMRYLIFSAIADVRYSNRDIAFLEELSALLFKREDIDRSYRYINYCLKNSLLYPNRVRTVGISSILDDIQKAYQEKSKKQELWVRISLVIISILTLVLLAALVLLRIQFKKLALSRSALDAVNIKLAQANKELKDLNAQLSRTNRRLVDLNGIKEEYIAYLFSVCSNYISKIEDYRKSVSRKLKTGQLDDIRKMTSNSMMVQQELKDFYHNFDTIFLHVYPDFVTDFNRLLRPEEQITVKEGELLNTELRIYALVRLGIQDSVKIADFLHCSAQTVYNNRVRTRNRARIPKEEFLEAVKELGKVTRGE